MTSFDFKQWCQTFGLKEGTIEQLEKNDLDSQEALKLVNKDDVATLDLTLGQRKLLLQAVALLDSKGKSDESKKTKSSETGPVTTKSLANDSGLEELLKKIGGISLDDTLVTLGATEQPFSEPLERVDNNPQVFLGTQQPAQGKKGGLTEGFRIVSRDSELRPADVANYKSATGQEVRDKVEEVIREEMQHGNYIVTTAKPTKVSALGAIPKPDSDNIRLIHDCSRPQHSNVNSYSDTKQHYSYVTVDKAVSLIKSNAYLAKINLKSAYRHVPIHPSNYTATGLAWHFRGDSTLTYLYDCKLPFGAAKSPEIFHRLTQAITRMMERRGFTVLAYLDDFLIISDTAQECKQAYQELIKLLGELGFQINWDKAVGPCQRLTFLGIEIDTVRRQLTLPERKLCELRLLLSETTAKRSITKREFAML
ncbi:hypothetical protein ACROYT_G014191 [Oculina patagonica]